MPHVPALNVAGVFKQTTDPHSDKP
ncbi:hypothetical protein D030_4228A, partial [Vibrio parahaemolyticus AQ3810]